MKDKLWGVYRGSTLLQVYTTEEYAKTVCDFLVPINIGAFGGPKQEKKFAHTVKEVYYDCFVNKIKNGYKTFRVIMKKNGEVISLKQDNVPLTSYGFSSKTIMPVALGTGPRSYEKALHWTGLAKDEKQAEYLANEARIPTLLDDVWQENQELL